MMLRKGIATLMITALSVVSGNAQDSSSPRNLLGWIRGAKSNTSQTSKSASGITHAVVDDAARQVPSVRQMAGPPHVTRPYGAIPALQPMPIQYAPVVPNTSAVSGPQYFSAPTSNGNSRPLHPGRNWQQYSAPIPVHMTSAAPFHQTANARVIGGSKDSSSNPNGHPGTGASLYPSPVAGIPHQIGGSAIVNQALHPHEMLYAHQYKAMYPPYYYKVNGGWMVTPFGVWSHEDWMLQGTTVDVKYKSHVSPFTLWKPPISR